MKRQLAPTVLLLLALLATSPSGGSGREGNKVCELLAALMSASPQDRDRAANRLLKIGDRSLVPALVDTVFFVRREHRDAIYRVLERLTGSGPRDYYGWVEWVGAHEEIRPREGYVDWKRSLLARIDRRYEAVLYPGAPARIRLEEVVFGGVPLAGIPALDDPPTLPGAEAGYLQPQEMVFGIELGEESRAYPLRILSWHELVNDRLGGEPITLSFCTLCGSGIFYSGRNGGGEEHRFDTSGLLYRSNKLMVDRRSSTLWANLTGEPVIGRLVGKAGPLRMLAGTLGTWEAWLARHPATTVLDLAAIERQTGWRFGFEYRPGAAERARAGVSFPVWKKSAALERDREVFALRIDAEAKVFPLDRLLAREVLNDQVGGTQLVLVADRQARTVRAYRREDYRFVAGPGSGTLSDQTGRNWRVEEMALRPLGEGDRVESLERLPGHVALWFGWYAFYPQTEIWRD